MPAVEFKHEYKINGNELIMEIEYEIADFIDRFPRFGIEFSIDKAYKNFSYIGYGPTESYIDKHIACNYGYYENSSEDNYDKKYIRPQESGSHYAAKYFSMDNLFEVTADLPFSFSVNPYTTKQLLKTLHSFELTKNDFVNVCIDLSMRGIGSKSCGPDLLPDYEIPKKLKNKFKFIF